MMLSAIDVMLLANTVATDVTFCPFSKQMISQQATSFKVTSPTCQKWSLNIFCQKLQSVKDFYFLLISFVHLFLPFGICEDPITARIRKVLSCESMQFTPDVLVLATACQIAPNKQLYTSRIQLMLLRADACQFIQRADRYYSR